MEPTIVVNKPDSILYGSTGSRGRLPLPEGITPEVLALGLRPELIKARSLRLQLEEHQELFELDEEEQDLFNEAAKALDDILDNQDYRRLQDGIEALQNRHQDMINYLPVAKNKNAKTGVTEIASELEQLLNQIKGKEQDYFVEALVEIREQIHSARQRMTSLDITPI